MSDDPGSETVIGPPRGEGPVPYLGDYYSHLVGTDFAMQAYRKPLYGDRFLEVSYIYSGGRGRIEILIGASGDIILAEELYLRSAWLDNLLSKYEVVANDLHTKISWDDLKAVWHKRFQWEPPEIKAMDKLMAFEQGTLPSADWIAEYQRLTSVPDIQMGFKAIRHYFISRSCPALSNALTHVEDTLTTTAELFDTAAQIIITNKEAKNLRSSAPGPRRDQHRPRVAVVAAAAPLDQTSEAVSASEGDKFAAAREVPIVHSIDDARKKELLAFVHALKRWRHFLLGRSQFRWVTDNNPLVFYKTQDTVNSTIARWMVFIDQFDFFPDHIPGKSKRFADALSRRPDHCTAVYSTFEIDDDLRNSFIRGYQADPEFRDKYANCSSPNPVPSHYRIQEGYLLVHTRGKDLFCVPSDPHLRTRLLGEFHDAPATGHFGVNRMIGRLRQRFWWTGLLGDVTRYCESCEVCRRCKSRNHRPYGELRPLLVPLRRREAISMDITGPFPKHKTRVDGILTVVDRLTKFATFLPCRYHAKAPELAEVLYAGWIRTKGYPKEIVCDRDTRFKSDFWLALIKRWGSSLKPNSARHPQTDGQTERTHQTAQVLLCTLIRPDQKDWVERLLDVELAYNSSIQTAIGISPFEFEHGSPVTSPLDTITPRTTESDDHLLFLRRMQELLVKARDQMAKTQQRMSQQANRQHLPCPFRVGDLVSGLDDLAMKGLCDMGP
ncbi:hypothetical protein CBR_g49805 [Chara braunii]|uniref:Integrase catalytic domain-containing protein n=1 Tax=Chara braunii TaxID=69332 RepID=A0A388JP32_CHABU|nr:hypothetical protein CBR_g49805 [Chara braunii]|eukprot:GBG59545.1 hypothetical protein CBR_g49805 [Chara braunii]